MKLLPKSFETGDTLTSAGWLARLTHTSPYTGAWPVNIEVRPGSGPIRKAGGFESMEHDLNDMMTMDDL
ncbi:hypothetical protein BM221_003131 [Beauveria bassiana]|uniref:Uncharacterized protein n=1 Tax=Beauveria bassiana TaxID=176275 RepID=A0A2N6NTU1_BEABA|nr:hypothetical protein BM221_003131 [Beauveria bassiana]